MTHRRLLPLAALALAATVPSPAVARDLLPDLDQERPTELQVRTDTPNGMTRFHLGFASAVDNIGAGPLIVAGHRASTAEPQMTADQTILQHDGSTRTVRDIGRLQYVHSETHDHWHYLAFDRYELRSAINYKLVSPDHKTGFCLGDRYNTNLQTTIPGEAPWPVYNTNCEKNHPEVTALTEGISVGYGDDYLPNLEGQWVDLTGLRAGEYYLVHRANADRKVKERNYANDAASVLVDLSWPQGTTQAPSVKVLRGCGASDACPGPHQQAPALARAAAERYALVELRRALGFKPHRFTLSCARKLAATSRACKARGAHSDRRYSVAETIAYERTKQGVIFYRYAVSGTVKGKLCKSSACVRKLKARSGRVRVGAAKASAAVSQPRQRFVALDHAPLDGVRLRPVVHEVPRLVRHALGGLRGRVAAQ
jgi:lysyl oxidase